ncbi:MAG: 4-hydroxythreonine-4-phosphate dehydrogenase PdxA [Verrucomicrobiota bacterium]
MSQPKVIGVTLGDPGGIGPEIIEQGLSLLKPKKSISYRIIGTAGKCRPGNLNRASAQKALAALNTSVKLLKRGEIHAVVNAPVAKHSLHQIGFTFPGQTEFYARAFGLKNEEVTMMMTSSKLKVSLVTTHCSLQEAIKSLSKKQIKATVRRTVAILNRMKVTKKRIAICSLNPHAGEEGLFGQEESKVIAPSIQALSGQYPDFEMNGPCVPDAIFRQAMKGEFSAVVCMYHDQGLIPFKLAAFEQGVNLTLGLPFLRCSPDHGTAVDIAGKGVASPRSFMSACRLMERLLR